MISTNPIDDDLPPDEPETAIDAARRRFIQAKLDAGWTHEVNGTFHPTDREISFLVDPFTGELIFTGKIAELLDEDHSADELVELIRRENARKKQEGKS